MCSVWSAYGACDCGTFSEAGPGQRGYLLTAIQFGGGTAIIDSGGASIAITIDGARARLIFPNDRWALVWVIHTTQESLVGRCFVSFSSISSEA